LNVLTLLPAVMTLDALTLRTCAYDTGCCTSPFGMTLVLYLSWGMTLMFVLLPGIDIGVYL